MSATDDEQRLCVSTKSERDAAYACLASKTALERFDIDGARCVNLTHWHPRRASGFAGARPVAAPVNRNVMPDPPKPLPAGHGQSEDDA